MKILIIVSALFLATVNAGVINANNKCEYLCLTKCADTFAKAVGLSSMPTDAFVLDAQIDKLISQGNTGMQQLCDAHCGIEGCLGEEYRQCVNLKYLESIGESEQNAREFMYDSKKVGGLCACASTSKLQSISNAQCDNSRFGQCTDTFAKALGLPNMPTDPTVLAERINKLIDDGKKDDVCKADNALVQCLGDQYDSCISVDYLKSIGESDSDARGFVLLADATRAMCMAPAANAQCDNNRFNQCTDTFAKAIGLQSMPTDATILILQISTLLRQGRKAQLCNADAALIQCLGDQYSTCINIDYLKSIGESNRDATLFVQEADYLKSQCSSSSNAQCEVAKFQTCTDAFAKNLNLPSMPTDASILDAQIKLILEKGEVGQEIVCGAFYGLQICLNTEYDSCISVDFLKSIGESDKDAQQFVAISNQLKKTCSQFVNFKVQNAKCEVDRLEKCARDFSKAMGLPDLPHSFTELDNAIQKWMTQGIPGIQHICKGYKALQSCLGDEYDSCVSVDFLKSIGASDQDAKGYVAESKKLQTMCKPFQQQNVICDDGRFQQCTDAFAKALGLSNMPTDAQTLIDQIDKLEKDGKKPQVCKADHALIRCLDDEYGSCMTVAYLENIGESEKDAKLFIQEAEKLQGQCAM